MILGEKNMYTDSQIAYAKTLLVDEMSKKVFDHRVAFAKSGDIVHLLNLIGDSLPPAGSETYATSIKLLALARKIAMSKEKQTVVIWGVGNSSSTPLQLLHEYFFTADKKPEIIGCDNNKNLWGTIRTHHNPNMRIPIVSPKTVNDMAIDKSCNAVLAFGQYNSVESVYNQLMDYGFTDDRVLKQTGFYEYQLGNIYLDREIMHARDNEFLVDIGAYDMANSIDFIRWCKGAYRKIVAFEADYASYENCKAVIAELGLDNCGVFYNAVFSSDTDITFISAPDGEHGGSRIDATGECTVKAVTLDGFLGNDAKDVSIIKMDIEGAEKDALSGAKETIAKYGPRLAISAYHKPFDVIELPMFIKELNPQYKFYLRHHTLGIWDTVLYAVK